jgi:hypothetical protein
VIRKRTRSGGAVLEGTLEPGISAYIDAEWLGGTEACEVAAMTVDLAGGLRFRGHTWQSPAGVGADQAALLAFSSFAQQAVDALTDRDREVVSVMGSGITAAEVRRLLDAARGSEAEADRPAAVIDTTGDPGVIIDATRRLADRGALILAGECLGRRTDINLYSDVHVRGLRVVGLGPLLSRDPAPGDPAERPDAGDSLAVVCFGEVLPTAMWYRVEA